jgi:hypothetical protein
MNSCSGRSKCLPHPSPDGPRDLTRGPADFETGEHQGETWRMSAKSAVVSSDSPSSLHSECPSLTPWGVAWRNRATLTGSVQKANHRGASEPDHSRLLRPFGFPMRLL